MDVNEAAVTFVLEGSDLNPNEITLSLGVTPTKTWRRGDVVYERSSQRHKYNGWSVKSTLDPSSALHLHVQSILERLRPSWPLLVPLCEQHDAEFSCVVYINELGSPLLHFDDDVVRQIAELRADIDIDVYCLREE